MGCATGYTSSGLGGPCYLINISTPTLSPGSNSTPSPSSIYPNEFIAITPLWVIILLPIALAFLLMSFIVNVIYICTSSYGAQFNRYLNIKQT
jgi:hypothetical protein